MGHTCCDRPALIPTRARRLPTGHTASHAPILELNIISVHLENERSAWSAVSVASAAGRQILDVHGEPTLHPVEGNWSASLIFSGPGQTELYCR